jgi:glycosyltransferase involved in cell wall biosynthesis
MAVVFWTCVLFVAYSYVGYGCALALMSRLRNRPVRRAPITPSVSFIIAAHNEAKRITEKIENTLRQDYPGDRFEIIVASDGSTDATDEIVRSYAHRGVRLIRPDQRRGKEYAQRTAIAAARGEVLVFSDVATRLDPDGVRQIVMSFDDPSVGCVSSVDRMIGSDGRPSGEGGYVRYEMQLRALESRVGSLVGLSGSFFAARREVCTPWPVDIPSDFTTVLNAVTRGLRGVSDGHAIGYYTDLADTSKEYSRKVRTVVRGISALFTHRALLNPFRFGLFAWQLASHKLFRWMVPFAMAGALLANLWLASDSNFYRILAGFHLAGYGLALLALRWPTPLLRAWRPVGFLLLANASILTAWMRVMQGKTIVVWTPSER